jgi:hypothetical protein
MFLSALFTAKAGSHVEDFMFVAELQLLAQGLLLKVCGRMYFLQVRLKLYIMDTKQLEKSFDCSCVHCLFGCFLCRHHGRWSEQSHLNKVLVNGHRVYLPMSHYLRQFGQTRNCCPKGYFTTTDTDFDDAVVQKAEKEKLEQKRKREGQKGKKNEKAGSDVLKAIQPRGQKNTDITDESVVFPEWFVHVEGVDSVEPLCVDVTMCQPCDPQVNLEELTEE